jgi:acetyl-CoA carboxylase biotin carboxyl carrier protein
MTMDYKAIINLMKEMNRTGLTRLEIEADGVRICMEKSPGNPQGDPKSFPQGNPGCDETFEKVPASVPVQPESQPESQPKAQPVAGANDKQDVPAAVKAGDKTLGYKQLVAPMVGTFYAQPAPDKPPYITVGDKVKKGQTICIIEAMKLMNEIESEYDGEVAEVLVKNEEMVEFGQPLFLLK